MQDASRVRDLWYASQRAQGVGEEMASRASSERAVGVCGVPVLGDAGSSQRPAPNGAAQGEPPPGGLRASRSLRPRPLWTWMLVETRKQEALHSYNKYRAYQPLTTYWAEAELIVHSEFRDGLVRVASVD